MTLLTNTETEDTRYGDLDEWALVPPLEIVVDTNWLDDGMQYLLEKVDNGKQFGCTWIA